MDIQMTVQVPDTGGFLIECNSGGWLPHTEMKWIDSKGNAIPQASKHSFQDGTGFFNLKMSVFLRNSTHGPVTCCFSNPVTGQEKRASIVIPGECSWVSSVREELFSSIWTTSEKMKWNQKCKIALLSINCCKLPVFILFNYWKENKKGDIFSKGNC